MSITNQRQPHKTKSPPPQQSKTLTLCRNTLTHRSELQGRISTHRVTNWQTWEVGLPWQQISTPWQRAYFERHIISGIMRGLPMRWRWLQHQLTQRCRGGRTGRTVRWEEILAKEGEIKKSKESRSGLRPLTSLVLQMSPRVAPQAFPGVAFQGIIPAGSERWNVTAFSHLRQEAFYSPETVWWKALWIRLR